MDILGEGLKEREEKSGAPGTGMQNLGDESVVGSRSREQFGEAGGESMKGKHQVRWET